MPITQSQTKIITSAAQSSFAALNKFADNLMTQQELEKIYELEYKLYLLSQRQNLSERANLTMLKMKEQLNRLLEKGLVVIHKAFKQWAQMTKDLAEFDAQMRIQDAMNKIKTMKGTPEELEITKQKELARVEEITEKINQAVKNVDEVLKKFEQGIPSDLKEKIVLFHEALNTAHTQGTMGAYIVKAPINEAEDLLNGLSSGEKYVNQWEDEIKKISKRAAGLGPIAPMKLRKLDNPDDILKDFDDSEIWIQPKIDGFKVQAIKDKGGSVKLYTRRSEDFTSNIPNLVSELEDKMSSGDFWLGELTYLKDGKQSISDVQSIVGSNPEKAQEKLKEKGQLVFYVYDLLWDAGTDITKQPYEERYTKLKKKVGKSKLTQIVDNYSYSEKDKAINDALKSGGEGIVLKPKKSEYKYGASGANETMGEWAKFKPKGKKANTDEVILKEYSKGKEKLIFPMYQYKGDSLFEVGQLSGMSKEDESKIKKDIDADKQVVVEITFQERMPSGKFRHVGWSRFRFDKSPKEVKFSSWRINISKRAIEEINIVQDPQKHMEYLKKILTYVNENLKTIQDSNRRKWLEKKRYDTMVQLKELEGKKPTYEWIDYSQEIVKLKKDLNKSKERLLKWQNGQLSPAELEDLQIQSQENMEPIRHILEGDVYIIEEQIKEYQRSPEEAESFEEYYQEHGPYSNEQAKYEATPPNPEAEVGFWTPEGKVQYYEEVPEPQSTSPLQLPQESLKLSSRIDFNKHSGDLYSLHQVSEPLKKEIESLKGFERNISDVNFNGAFHYKNLSKYKVHWRLTKYNLESKVYEPSIQYEAIVFVQSVFDHKSRTILLNEMVDTFERAARILIKYLNSEKFTEDMEEIIALNRKDESKIVLFPTTKNAGEDSTLILPPTPEPTLPPIPEPPPKDYTKEPDYTATPFDPKFDLEVDIRFMKPYDLIRYFLFKHYKRDKYAPYNPQILKKLFDVQPSKFFDLELFADPEFKSDTRRAALHVAVLEPQYFMAYVLPNFPEEATGYKSLALKSLRDEKDIGRRRHELMFSGPRKMSARQIEASKIDYPHKLYKEIVEWIQTNAKDFKRKWLLFGGKNIEEAEFYIDLSDTEQYRKHPWFAKALTLEQSNGFHKYLTVILHKDDPINRQGTHYYDNSSGKHEIHLYGILDALESGRIFDSLKHELIHLAQLTMSDMIYSKKFWEGDTNPNYSGIAGLPGYYNPETYKMYGRPESLSEGQNIVQEIERHYLSDIEFYTNLNDQIERMKRKVGDDALSKRDVSSLPELKNYSKNMDELPENLKQKMLDNRFKHFIDSNQMLNVFKSKAPEKFEKAVRELYKVYQSFIKKQSNLDLVLVKYASGPLNKEDLERIYELEYIISALEKESNEPQIVKGLMAELNFLLLKGLKELRAAFDKWLNNYDHNFKSQYQDRVKMYQESSEYEQMPEEMIKFIVESKHYDNPIYKRIKNMRDLLEKKSTDVKQNSALFNEALNISHHTGGMIDFLPNVEETGISSDLLKDLTEGKYISKWQKQVRKMSSVLSKRAKYEKEELDNIKIYFVDGKEVRAKDIEFAIGGHHWRYSFIPKNEIWIEKNITDKEDLIPDLVHEFVERLVMKCLDFGYDDAHEFADKAEKVLRKQKLSKQAKTHDSAGIFSVLPSKLGKQFPSLGDHDDSKPHVTVLYVGKVPKSKHKLLKETVEKVMSEQEPFELKLDDDVSYFPATKHSDDCRIAKMKVVSEPLHKLHKKLKEALEDVGIKIDDHFPTYKPHVTLEYVEPPKKEYEGKVPSGSWTMKSVEIWGCGQNKEIFLGKKISKKASSINLNLKKFDDSMLYYIKDLMSDADEKEIKETFDFTTKATHQEAQQFVAKLQELTNRIPNWSSPIQISVYVPYTQREDWDYWQARAEGKPVGTYYVRVGSVDFTYFSDGTVDDVLDVGDEDGFFKSPAEKRDYFMLIKALQNKPMAQSNRPLKLYTARPAEHRDALLKLAEQKKWPNGIFLTNSLSFAEGFGADYGESRDIWAVVVPQDSLVFDESGSMGHKQYQLFGTGEFADIVSATILNYGQPKQASISKRAKDPLATYKKKRDFDETPEPEGKAEKGKNKHRFVIQHHFAEKAGEHFDMRLENDQGTLSSYVIPQAKLPKGKDRLLVVQSEDHPLSYRLFEGEIESGYGKGKVKQYDIGTYVPVKMTKDTIKIKLKGKKEHGSYTLHRTSGKNWIIMVMKEKDEESE